LIGLLAFSLLPWSDFRIQDDTVISRFTRSRRAILLCRT
jgi:hypothetical protein